MDVIYYPTTRNIKAKKLATKKVTAQTNWFLEVLGLGLFSVRIGYRFASLNLRVFFEFSFKPLVKCQYISQVICAVRLNSEMLDLPYSKNPRPKTR